MANLYRVHVNEKLDYDFVDNDYDNDDSFWFCLRQKKAIYEMTLDKFFFIIHLM